ncbi:hypothetical protein DH2020_009124 [Rehmannia glutinosa]|uniref:Phytochrome n=1 Tax=Rehmannia glutinosa TaxID=99300 RepID=A0ABR0X7Y4_REHGL
MELQSKKGKTPATTKQSPHKSRDDNITNPDLSSSAASSVNINNRTMAQFSADARLMAEFEQSGVSGKFFNYAKSVPYAPPTVSTEEQMIVYLSRIQRGGLVQPFGCMLAIDDRNFNILGYSENCFDMLGIKNLVEASLIGIDARTLFTPSSRASLAKAVASRDLSFLNPIWVHSRTNHRPFYAVLHRIDVGIVIDLEPAHSGDPAMVHAFHDDNHGEVLSEIRRSDLDPYLGLHYPATDIPQAARFLFKQNRVRMICDCNALPVKIVQSEDLKQPLCLVNSTLRSPHGCHTQYMANMGSIASLVMAVVVNNGDSMKLWGLVVCHHTSPRYVPFPLRYACEFLMQAFGLQLFMELQLASQLAEKKVLKMQTLLCDMLLRDAPFGIVTQSPSIMDLVKCDGAALYYGGKCWCLGVTPTEAQLKDIAEWLLSCHGDSTGLSTECLADAGYPGALLLGDAVCGMATARINSADFLFWFRSHTAKEIKWGGAKHHPEDKDGGGKMHPRTSFNAFLEVVKSRSLPWEAAEINAIHSLQLIMRDSFQEIEERGPKRVKYSQQNNHDDRQLDELSSVAVEMVRLIETASAPIFGVDSSGLINGWNSKMCKEDKNVEVKLLKFGIHAPNSFVYLLANATHVVRMECGHGKADWLYEARDNWEIAARDIFGSLCQLKGQDVLTKFMILLYRAIGGHDTEKLPFGFFNRKGEFVDVCLTANKRVDESGSVIGCLCFLQTVVVNEKESIVDKVVGYEHVSKLKELAYIRQEMKNPLYGIRFTHQLLERSAITDDQKQFLETSDACERQILSVINDADFGSLEEGKMELKEEEFHLGNVVNAIVSQAMILLREKNLRLIHDIPEQIKTLCVYGDQIKLQLALSDLLICIVDYAPSQDGWVEIKVSPGLKLIQDGNEFVHLQFRMAHPGQGLPDALVEDMYGVKTHWTRQEGMALNISQKLVEGEINVYSLLDKNA